MSLDGPAVIAGTATDGQPFFSKLVTLDMDTPMPMKRGAGQMGLDTPSSSSVGLMRSASTGTGLSALTGGVLQTPSRDLDSREMRDFWKQYMRTSLFGPMDGRLEFGMMSSSKAAIGSGYRRQRVAPLPSVKTPVVERRGTRKHKSVHGASTSSLENAFGTAPSFNSQQHNAQYTQRITSLSVSRFTLSSGNDSESGGSPAPLSSRGSSVDPDGKDCPSFKRLPSQTLGPENTKRAFLGYGDDDERVSGWNTSSQGHVDGTHNQNNSTLAPVPKMSLGLGGISHPDQVVASLAERRRRRMSAPSTSLTPLDPNAAKDQQHQPPPEMKLPTLG